MTYIADISAAASSLSARLKRLASGANKFFRRFINFAHADSYRGIQKNSLVNESDVNADNVPFLQNFFILVRNSVDNLFIYGKASSGGGWSIRAMWLIIQKRRNIGIFCNEGMSKFIKCTGRYARRDSFRDHFQNGSEALSAFP